MIDFTKDNITSFLGRKSCKIHILVKSFKSSKKTIDEINPFDKPPFEKRDRFNMNKAMRINALKEFTKVT